VTTKFLDTMPYYPAMLEIIAPGISTTIQDLPGRYKGLGIPRGGSADPLAHKLANFLVGNDPNTETLEMTMTGAKVLFHADTVVAVTGAEVPITVDKKPAEMWKTLCIKAGSVLNIASAVRRLLTVRIWSCTHVSRKKPE
jgi:urea carboxylase